MPKVLKKMRNITMRTLKHLLFAAAFIFCISISASAQKKDGRKTPPKDPPPVVVVKDEKEKEKPRDDKNRGNDNRGKKPQAYFFRMEDK